MLIAFSDDSRVLRARVTTTPDQATRACNLAELILNSRQFPWRPRATNPTGPPGPAARNPEAAPTESNAAEQPRQTETGLVAGGAGARKEPSTRGGRSAHPTTVPAHGLRLCHRRPIPASHDPTEGRGSRAPWEAFPKASRFIRFYASMATSGGEGEALPAAGGIPGTAGGGRLRQRPRIGRSPLNPPDSKIGLSRARASKYPFPQDHETHPEQNIELAVFPPVLKSLIEAELAAGNSLFEIGGGHPAPPIGRARSWRRR